MEDKSAPQEGPREGAAPASPGAGPNSPLQAANKRGAAPKAEAPQKSPGSLRDITNAEAPAPAPRDDDAFWAAAADAASQAEAGAPDDHSSPRAAPARRPEAQVDLPNDDDLANWSHHASVATTGDEVLKSAMAGSALVSFVFGMEVTADLVRAHAAS